MKGALPVEKIRRGVSKGGGKEKTEKSAHQTEKKRCRKKKARGKLRVGSV